jgi:hypothetical protein
MQFIWLLSGSLGLRNSDPTKHFAGQESHQSQSHLLPQVLVHSSHRMAIFWVVSTTSAPYLMKDRRKRDGSCVRHGLFSKEEAKVTKRPSSRAHLLITLIPASPSSDQVGSSPLLSEAGLTRS